MEAQKAAKIMLVEDDPTMRNVLKTLLEIEGFRVVNVPDRKSVAEIVAHIKSEAPDVTLLDVHLRETSGLDVLGTMRADPDLQNVRVIMTSGMDVREQCLKAGANAFLLKPYMPDELIKLLRS